MDYGSESLLKILKKQIKYNSRFMDVYDNIIFNSEMIISAAFLFPKKFREEISNEFFERYINEIGKSTYNINAVYKFVYEDEIEDEGYNSYKMINKITNLYTQYAMKLFDIEIDSVIKYLKKNNMQNEMKVVYAEMLSMKVEKSLFIRTENEDNISNALILMKGNDYKVAELNLRMYYVYKENNKILLAQKKLSELYNMAINKKELNMTMLYCDILVLVLLDYDGNLDRNDLINKLIETAPKVYGNNKKIDSVYKVLKNEIKDDRLLDIY